MNIPFLTQRHRMQEHFDWLIVRYASEHGDQDASLALALCRIINHEIEQMQLEHDHYQGDGDPAITAKKRTDHCRLLTDRIGDLKRQRRLLIYNGYKLRAKKRTIYLQSITGSQLPQSK